MDGNLTTPRSHLQPVQCLIAKEEYQSLLLQHHPALPCKIPIQCANCNRKEDLSVIHTFLFQQWMERPSEKIYNMLPQVEVRPSPNKIGDGLFATEPIKKGQIITFYPHHGVFAQATEQTGSAMFLVELSSQVDLIQAYIEDPVGTQWRNVMLTQLANTCAFQCFALPHTQFKPRVDEMAHIANDSVELGSITRLASAFCKNPCLETRRAFDDAVNAFAPKSNCMFNLPCPLQADDGPYRFAGIQVDSNSNGCIIPVPSLVATRDIDQGEELLTFYTSAYWLEYLLSKMVGYDKMMELSVKWPTISLPPFVNPYTQ